MTTQPIWKFIANLGDVSPLEYGGLFVYVDTTGVYPPEAEKVQPIDEDDEDSKLEIRRFILEECTYNEGILSDNRFHPLHPVWFADDLPSLARTYGMAEEELLNLFLSDNPCERAVAWEMVGDYFGWDNLDSYPDTITREEAETRYTVELQ